VNTGSFDKRNIAREIEILNSLEAKVIALDIAFPDYSGDKVDRDVITAIERGKNVVLPSRVHSSGTDYSGKDIVSVVSTCALPIVPLDVKEGFVSAQKVDMAGIQIPRAVMLWLKDYTGEMYYHFSVATAIAYDSARAIDYVESHSQVVDLDFTDRGCGFKVFSGSDLRSGKVGKADIAGKIVLLGFLGLGDDDKFISPSNTKREEPDMYGMEYLACIIAQILFR
jgi:CHASE2 domain-containing sensor protein